MRRPRVWCEIFEHPEHGKILVWSTWRRDDYVHGGTVREAWRPCPIAIEFDLFTPDSVRSELTAQLLGPELSEDRGT